MTQQTKRVRVPQTNPMRTEDFQNRVKEAKAILVDHHLDDQPIITRHFRPMYSKRGLNSEVSNHGGATVRLLIDNNNNRIYSAMTFCRGDEQFDRKLANDICLIRLANLVTHKGDSVMGYLSEVFEASELNQILQGYQKLPIKVCNYDFDVWDFEHPWLIDTVAEKIARRFEETSVEVYSKEHPDALVS